MSDEIPIEPTLNERVLDIEARLVAIEHYLATNGA
jgi:hypothetical protein